MVSIHRHGGVTRDPRFRNNVNVLAGHKVNRAQSCTCVGSSESGQREGLNIHTNWHMRVGGDWELLHISFGFDGGLLEVSQHLARGGLLGFVDSGDLNCMIRRVIWSLRLDIRSDLAVIQLAICPSAVTVWYPGIF
jgi:hypothetical protein